MCVAVRTNCDLTYLFMLNIFALFSVVLFFHFKGCLLTLFMYKIINVKHWINPVDRITYLVGLDRYNIRLRDSKKIDVNAWINGQYLFFVALLCLNIFYFIKPKC